MVIIKYEISGESSLQSSRRWRVAAPVMDLCLQRCSTPVLGPLWVSRGEGFSPKGVIEFLTGIINYTKGKLKEAKNYQTQVCGRVCGVASSLFIYFLKFVQIVQRLVQSANYRVNKSTTKNSNKIKNQKIRTCSTVVFLMQALLYFSILLCIHFVHFYSLMVI